MKKVLVLDEQSNIRSFLIINLKRSGYEPIEVTNPLEALKLLQGNDDIRLAVLDITLPDIDGFEFCRRVRANGSNIGLIILSAKADEIDKVTGFVAGADDYVTKPFSLTELIARIDALWRRVCGNIKPEPSDIISLGDFTLNTRKRSLEKSGKLLRLTQIEYAIMKLFMDNNGKALSREEILNRIWGRDYYGELKIVDVNIRRLRIKIEDNPTDPRYISTIWGFGYKLEI